MKGTMRIVVHSLCDAMVLFDVICFVLDETNMEAKQKVASCPVLSSAC